MGGKEQGADNPPPEISICGTTVLIQFPQRKVIVEIPDYNTREELLTFINTIMNRLKIKEAIINENPLRAGRDLQTGGI